MEECATAEVSSEVSIGGRDENDPAATVQCAVLYEELMADGDNTVTMPNVPASKEHVGRPRAARSGPAAYSPSTHDRSHRRPTIKREAVRRALQRSRLTEAALREQLQVLVKRETVWQQRAAAADRSSKALRARMQLLQAGLCNERIERCCMQHRLAFLQRQLVAHNVAACMDRTCSAAEGTEADEASAAEDPATPQNVP